MLWICSFGEGLSPETTKARLGGRACLISWGLEEGRERQPETPSISQDRQLKNTVFESGGAWPLDSLRQDGPTQPQGTAMEPQFVYARAETPPDPIRRHSRPRGRCEGIFWRPFNPKDIGRYLMAAERFERAGRKRGERSGPLGGVALEVLRELVRLVDYRTGRLEPALTTIMRRVKRSKDAVVRALANLRTHGFLDWMRRWEPTGDTQGGPPVKQATNAYRLFLPPAAEALLGCLASPAPHPEDIEHARAAQLAAVVAMVDGLPLDEQPAAAGATGSLAAALSRLGRGLMRRECESSERSESSSSG